MKGTVLAILLLVACGIGIPASQALPQEARTAQESERAEDPVCHLLVRKNPELSVRYRGETYYFCMKADMETFKKDPDKYLQGTSHTHPDPGR